MSEYKILDTEFEKSGFRFRQLRREGFTAIYHKAGLKGPKHPVSFDAGFEVVVISENPRYTLNNGLNWIEAAEGYPSPEMWGSRGWTFTNLLAAENKYESLLGKKSAVVETSESEESEESVPNNSVNNEAPKHRGRTKGERPQLLIEALEFSCKDLAEANKVEYPIAAVFIKEAVEAGSLKFVREERRQAKGKPTKIYSKV